MKEQLATLLSQSSPRSLQESISAHACVALILRGKDWPVMELGFIQRAHDPQDRWSGQLAFPGGRREESDPSDIAAALRETSEEVGIHLSVQDLAGRLDDIQARKAGSLLDFYIRPFVFHTEQEHAVKLDATEVADFFWVPVKELINPARKTQYTLHRESDLVSLPALYLDREPPLWGLTYMMVLDLLQRLRLITD
ncbi:MAG: CoA pyrophosphatase [Bdellovibrio sp.]